MGKSTRCAKFRPVFKTRIRWYKIGASTDAIVASVPLNGVKGINVGGKNICLVHTTEGLSAVRDKCPHQGVRLSKGGCAEDGKIVCAWHRYAFDLKTGRGAGLHVDVYPIEIRDDGVYLGMEYLSLF